ncbi:shikimate kinase [Bosea sp. (in: a-proteobacteria)]|jgi:shikimate kinase|uniref:shikimate kinase n=1 Tax=Bosea sp. (in: a-proteobacteria) TaxID=1871050 RepID=UPI0027356D46|nr:shikimate kinase [Bosea sp. (in: a-proteobacteria)]MDP3408702.1 shikimate kinase [Bosea sp. (in: a-proteobacteria)]
MTTVATLDQPDTEECQVDRETLRAAIGQRAIVLVGMMGSGKSSVGRRLATRLGLPFVDADTEIETAAGMTISEIFAQRGETEFRNGERRVISRILTTRAPLVLATGGGAFMNAETRARIADLGISIWLKAEPEVLMRRVRKRSNRPLLQTADPEATLRAMLAEREPVYALSDLTLVSRDDPHDVVVTAAIAALDRHLGAHPDRKPVS